MVNSFLSRFRLTQFLKKKKSMDYTNFYRFIAYGYLIKNYSKKFIKNIDYHLVTSSMSKDSCIAIFSLNGCGDFKLFINIKNNAIIHDGNYEKNRNYPNEKLIKEAKDKFNII